MGRKNRGSIELWEERIEGAKICGNKESREHRSVGRKNRGIIKLWEERIEGT